MARLSAKVRVAQGAVGAVLFNQGDPGDSLIVLLSGQIRLTHYKNGSEHLTALLGRRGDTVGEMTLLTGRSRSVAARVEKDAEWLVLDRTDFELVLKDNPDLALPLARQLSDQLVDATPSGKRPGRESRLYALFAPVPEADRAILAINAALSLSEQTREPVLLVDFVGPGEKGLGGLLGLGDPPRAADTRVENYASPSAIAPLIRLHATGLEVLTLPANSFTGAELNHLYPLINTLRRQARHILVAFKSDFSPLASVFAEAADRTLVMWASTPSAVAETLWRRLEERIPATHLDRIDLVPTLPLRRNRPGHFIVLWPRDLAAQRLASGRPLLGTQDPQTVQGIHRMARHWAGLRMGLAMGSGAALGYSIIGILRVLEKNGIYPDLIAGTSMGALIGSFYALGKSPDELEKIALTITKPKLWSLMDFGLPWQGVVIGNEVLKFLKSILGDATFDDLRVPFATVATDINTGQERVIRHGAVAEAVRASLSLPFFFKPFLHQGRYLVDGGLVNPVPSSVVRHMGANLCIGVNITTKPENKRFPGFQAKLSPLERLIAPNVFRVMTKTLYTMQYGIALTRAHDSDVVLAPDLSDFTWNEFHRAKEIIKIGEENTEHMLPKIKAMIPAFADACPWPPRTSPPITPY